jgi:hypothetical protein
MRPSLRFVPSPLSQELDLRLPWNWKRERPLLAMHMHQPRSNTLHAVE